MVRVNLQQFLKAQYILLIYQVNNELQLFHILSAYNVTFNKN